MTFWEYQLHSKHRLQIYLTMHYSSIVLRCLCLATIIKHAYLKRKLNIIYYNILVWKEYLKLPTDTAKFIVAWHKNFERGLEWVESLQQNTSLRQEPNIVRLWCLHAVSALEHLTHWNLNKMADILQTARLNTFSWENYFVFSLKSHWSLFAGVQWTIRHHWFKY